MKNKMQISFLSRSSNESFARIAVSGFLAQLDPTVDELSEIKTVISEAVTNSIVHGYKDYIGTVYITVAIEEDSLVTVTVRDKGCGIEDINEARRPLFTSCTTGERAGMGFTIMESFSDSLKVYSTPGKGTKVVIRRKLKAKGKAVKSA